VAVGAAGLAASGIDFALPRRISIDDLEAPTSSRQCLEVANLAAALGTRLVGRTLSALLELTMDTINADPVLAQPLCQFAKAQRVGLRRGDKLLGLTARPGRIESRFSRG
jgi:hypothetical protein